MFGLDTSPETRNAWCNNRPNPVFQVLKVVLEGLRGGLRDPYFALDIAYSTWITHAHADGKQGIFSSNEMPKYDHDLALIGCGY